jgi:uncharacterized protein (UPF0371 family)
MMAGFDSDRYLPEQARAIMERVGKFGGRLYLEFGGKLCSDLHAARVLPGYDPKNKIKLLRMLEDVEIVYCVCAKDLQKGTIRQDLGLTYDNETLKTIDDLGEEGLRVSAVVITRCEGEAAAESFMRKLRNLGERVFVQGEIRGYPKNIDFVVSDRGFGRQTYVPVKGRVIIVTGAGGGSGKMAFCLSVLGPSTPPTSRIASATGNFETISSKHGMSSCGTVRSESISLQEQAKPSLDYGL